MLMSAIQVKNVPEDLHAAARERAEAMGMSLADYVLTLLRRDLAVPSRGEWFVRVGHRSATLGLDAAEAVRQAREERDEHLAHRRS
jgi:plasmid stability protein